MHDRPAQARLSPAAASRPGHRPNRRRSDLPGRLRIDSPQDRFGTAREHPPTPPRSPQARSSDPSPPRGRPATRRRGPRTSNPSASSCGRSAAWTGCPHIVTFIAGASSTGVFARSTALSSSVTMSSVRPVASRARQSIVHGATNAASARDASEMCCGSWLSTCSHALVYTAAPRAPGTSAARRTSSPRGSSRPSPPPPPARAGSPPSPPCTPRSRP
jgi:hypothetical protein